jgi:hypothetical protein
VRICVGDLEANGLLAEATKVHCGVFKDIKTKEKVKFSPLNGEKYIEEMLAYLDTVDILIMHNGIGYDWPLLKKLYGYDYKGRRVDTLIMSRTQNPKRIVPHNCPNKGVGPHSVEAWGYRVGRGKPEHNDWESFSPEMLHRCDEDVEIQHLIYDALMQEGKGYNWRAAHLLNFDLFTILQEQEKYGWLVSREQIDRNISLLSHWMNRFDKILIPLLPDVLVIEETKKAGEYGWVKKPFKVNGQYNDNMVKWFLDTSKTSYEQIDRMDRREVGGPFCRVSYRRVNLDSNDEAKAYLLAEGWIPEQYNYKKVDGKLVRDAAGNLIKTSPKLSYDESFEGITSNSGKFIAKRVQCRHRRSVLEGWIDLIRPDGRISGRVTGLAATGRATHGGIVNVPGAEAFFGKSMRKCFICKPGFKIVGTDSAGCQNRMLAARVGDDAFTKTLIEGKKEDKTSIHHVNQHAVKTIAGFDVSYGLAKGLNYAFMFGASDNKLGMMVGGGKEAGARVREALLSVSAGFAILVDTLLKEWRGNAKRRLNKWGKPEYYNGWVVGLDGRPIMIQAEHTILVYLLQSDEAIMMAKAYTMLYHRAKERGWVHGVDYGILIWYHDEWEAEVREDIAEEFAEMSAQCIVDAGGYYKIACPHEGESKIGESWYDVH